MSITQRLGKNTIFQGTFKKIPATGGPEAYQSIQPVEGDFVQEARPEEWKNFAEAQKDILNAKFFKHKNYSPDQQRWTK